MNRLKMKILGAVPIRGESLQSRGGWPVVGTVFLKIPLPWSNGLFLEHYSTKYLGEDVVSAHSLFFISDTGTSKIFFDFAFRNSSATSDVLTVSYRCLNICVSCKGLNFL